MMGKKIKTFLFLLIFMIPCYSLRAQEQNKVLFAHGSRYIKKSDAENINGEFSLSRSEFKLSTSYKAFDKMPVDVGFGVRNYYVNDDTLVNLPNTLQSKSFNLGLRVPMPYTESNNMFLGLDLIPNWNSAADHDFADETFNLNYALSFIYRENNDYILACGMWIRPGYENEVIPFVGFRYKAHDKLFFNFLSSQPNIEYIVSDKLKVLFQLAFLSSEFKVTEGSRKGDNVRINDLEAGLALEYGFSDFSKGILSAGIAFSQKYEYVDANQEIKPKDSFYFGYKINIIF